MAAIKTTAHRGYDVIGDIHGCAHTLERLLEQMGYRKRNGIYQHPSRQAIFIGDIIDRGPRIREALHLVRDMVEHGFALHVDTVDARGRRLHQWEGSENRRL